MVTRTTIYAYEQSSEAGRERHVLMPQARLKDTSPTEGDPACVTAVVAGHEICGTVITVNAANDTAIINFAEGAIYRHNVRNVITWEADAPAAEAAWRAINIGDPVFYDDDCDTVNGVKLSTALTDWDGVLNPRFGTVVMLQDEVATDFEKGDDQEGLSVLCAVLQCGLNDR